MAGPANLHILHPEGASDIAAAVEKLKREMPQIREYNQQMAKVIRSEFDSYVAEGFTAAQALQLVKAKLAPSAK